VHCNILASGESKASIFEIIDSGWLISFNPNHLAKCKHYQIMFYDEIYDIIYEKIIPGMGKLNTK